MKHKVRPSDQQGSVLAMVMAFMFVLMTIVIAMHTTQTKATRSVTQAVAELQFRQSAEFTAAEIFSTAQTAPSSLRVSADAELVGDHNMPEAYGSKLWGGLPNWSPKDQNFAPGHVSYQLEPSTSDDALKVFAGKNAWLVGRSDGGYSAYAPEGSITLERAVGWANPIFGDERTAAQAYSGVPFTAAAKGKVEILNMPYGNAYSLDGPIDLGDSNSDLSVAYRGRLPLRSYEEALKTSLANAKSGLETAAMSGDKTKDINGGLDVGTVLKLMGGSSAPSLSLQQAMEFPFPMIPSFSATIPGVFFEFWFHVPYAPDFTIPNGAAQALEQKTQADAEKLEQLNTQIAALEKQLYGLDKYLTSLQSADPKTPQILAEIASVQSQIANGDPDSEQVAGLNPLVEKLEQKGNARTVAEDDLLVELTNKRDIAQNKLDSLENEIKDLNDDKVAEGQAWENQLKAGVGSENVPVTRAQDAGIPDKGQRGWNYSRVVGDGWNILGLLFRTAFTGDFEALAEEFSEKVRVVHFGGENYVPEFTFSSGSFSAKASWTVPPGRSFRYDGDMEIKGDLWVQKGAIMSVTGDLKMVDPATGNSALEPSGKIVLEEGASLIVGGSLEAGGRPKYGSIWTCSPLGSISPVSSAIFVGGSADIPYGSFSAGSLSDIASGIDGLDSTTQGLEALAKLGPNVSKIAGPFHSRKPYFAEYATTFQLTIVHTVLFGSWPVPTPIPLPKPNMLVPIFRATTLLYTGSMNAALGENTYLHADWWGYGEGVVPVMLKVDPTGPLSAIKNLNLNDLKPNFDFDSQFAGLGQKIFQELVTFTFKEVGGKVVKEIMKSLVGPGSWIGALESLMPAVGNEQNFLETLATTVIDGTVGQITAELEAARDKIEDEIDNAMTDAYLREVGGPLIQADSITVGSAGAEPKLMAGMLVAEGDIQVDAEVFVGSMTSFNGDIRAKRVYFTPLFTRASLYQPKSTSSNSLGRVAEVSYGSDFDSGKSFEIGTGVWQITTEGWSR